jgi:hypothetical protein
MPLRGHFQAAPTCDADDRAVSTRRRPIEESLDRGERSGKTTAPGRPAAAARIAVHPEIERLADSGL